MAGSHRRTKTKRCTQAAKLKNVKTGRVIDKTLNAGIRIDEVRIERRDYQFLYKDDLGYNFMDTETYEQISIEKNLAENQGYVKTMWCGDRNCEDKVKEVLQLEHSTIMVDDENYELGKAGIKVWRNMNNAYIKMNKAPEAYKQILEEYKMQME